MVFWEPDVLPGNWIGLSSVVGQYMPGEGGTDKHIDNGEGGLCGSRQLSLMHWSTGSVLVLEWVGL